MFFKLSIGKLAAATDSKSTFALTGLAFLAAMLGVAIMGACGVTSRSKCLLSVYAMALGVMFVVFWVSFCYMKRGKGTRDPQ